MSRRDKHRERLPPFVPVTHQVLESKAFKALTGNAVRAYLYFMRICTRVAKGKPDTATIFNFTYSEAVKLGFCRRTFYNAIKDLIEHGFIDQVEVGGLRGAGHSSSQFKLSDRWALWGGIGWAQQAQRGPKK